MKRRNLLKGLLALPFLPKYLRKNEYTIASLEYEINKAASIIGKKYKIIKARDEYFILDITEMKERDDEIIHGKKGVIKCGLGRIDE